MGLQESPSVFQEGGEFRYSPLFGGTDIPLETKHDIQFHGNDGPIHTSFSTYRIPIEKEWVAASSAIGKNAGLPLDGYSGNHMGSFHGLSTIDRSAGPFNGTRSYATTGYLLPNAGRPDLHVLTHLAYVAYIITGPSKARVF